MMRAVQCVRTSAIVIGTLAASTVCPAPTEKVLESGRGFMTRVYTDTEVESFSRTTQHLRGVISSRRDSVFYIVWLGDSGLVRTVDLISRSHGRGGSSVHGRHVPMPQGTLPMMHGSGALLEQLLPARACAGRRFDQRARLLPWREPDDRRLHHFEQRARLAHRERPIRGR